MTIGAKRRRPGPAQGPGTGHHLQLPAPQRPGLELRRRQLPEGRVAAAVRPAVLERRHHQPAGPDVLLVPAPHLPAERAQGAGQADGVRREGRPPPHRGAGVRLRLARRPHRAVAGGLCVDAGARAARSASCSVRRATSPASSTRRPRASAATGSTAPAARPSAEAWFDRRHRAPRQLVARLGRLAASRWPASMWPRPRRLGNAQFKAIEPAPGRYVKAKA